MPMTDGVLTVLPTPAGYVVDFDHPQRNADIAGYWVTGIGLFLSTSFLAMRMYTKMVITKNFSVDDAALLVSFVSAIAVSQDLTNWLSSRSVLLCKPFCCVSHSHWDKLTTPSNRRRLLGNRSNWGTCLGSFTGQVSVLHNG